MLAIPHSYGNRFTSQPRSHVHPRSLSPYCLMFYSEYSCTVTPYLASSFTTLRCCIKSRFFLLLSRKYKSRNFSLCSYPNFLSCPNRRVKPRQTCLQFIIFYQIRSPCSNAILLVQSEELFEQWRKKTGPSRYSVILS